MRILICGGRDFSDWGLFTRVMIDVSNKYTTADNRPHYISGGARGADRFAVLLAKGWGIPIDTYPADWKTFRRKAGILRNIDMLEQGKPDLVVAFPGGRGTAHMVRIAKEAGVEVLVVNDEGVDIVVG